MLFADLAPALLSTSWVFTYSLPIGNLTIIFLMVIKSLKPLLELFSKIVMFFGYLYRSLISVLFFGICTDLLYRYYFPVFVSIFCISTIFSIFLLIPISVPFSCIMIYDTDIHSAYYWTYYYLPVITWHLYIEHLTCHYLTPDSCLLLPDTCLISLITCHLIYYHLTCDYHISGILSCYHVLYYTVICISSTYVLLLLL